MNGMVLLVILYEAMCPLCVWLMAEGLLPESLVLAVFEPLIGMAGHPGVIADRQAYWIDVVYAIRVLVYAVLGREM